MSGKKAKPFWDKKIVTESGCWEWTGTRSHGGYGRVCIGRMYYGAHRVAYEIMKGSIPAGMTIDHLCRNPSCINPEHMEVVTLVENVMRGTSPAAMKSRQTKCKNGHEFDVVRKRANGRSYRRCSICDKNYDKNIRGKKLAALETNETLGE